MRRNNRFKSLFVSAIVVIILFAFYLSSITRQISLGQNLAKFNLMVGFKYKTLSENSLIVSLSKNNQFSQKSGALIIGVRELNKSEMGVTDTSALFDLWEKNKQQNTKLGKLPLVPGYPELISWEIKLFPKLNKIKIAEVRTPIVSNYVPKEIDVLKIKHRSFIFVFNNKIFEIDYFMPTNWLYSFGYKFIMKSLVMSSY